MSSKTFVFQCSSDSYLTCMEKGLFGTNLPWALEVKEGDYCLLHHYEAGTLLGLWQAYTHGGKKLIPKAWNGKFPYQVKIRQVSPKILEVPKNLLTELDVDPSMGRFDYLVEEGLAKRIQEFLVAK